MNGVQLKLAVWISDILLSAEYRFIELLPEPCSIIRNGGSVIRIEEKDCSIMGQSGGVCPCG